MGITALAVLLLFGGTFLSGVAFRSYYRQAYPLRYEETILREARANGVPPELILAVCRTESSFRPGAVSHVGARGIMQLTEETFDWVKSRKEPLAPTRYEDMYDPEQGIAYGAFLLKILLEEFGSVENALCAYHAGWGNVKSWLADPQYTQEGRIVTIPFPDTDAYVAKVVRTMELYGDLYPQMER